MNADTIKWILKGFELLLADRDYRTYNGEEIEKARQIFFKHLSLTIGETIAKEPVIDKSIVIIREPEMRKYP
jgi:hypothetical protein